jgi:hypothetical protein
MKDAMISDAMRAPVATLAKTAGRRNAVDQPARTSSAWRSA